MSTASTSAGTAATAASSHAWTCHAPDGAYPALGTISATSVVDPDAAAEIIKMYLDAVAAT